jgi:hypothetical protein
MAGAEGSAAEQVIRTSHEQPAGDVLGGIGVMTIVERRFRCSRPTTRDGRLVGWFREIPSSGDRIQQCGRHGDVSGHWQNGLRKWGVRKTIEETHPRIDAFPRFTQSGRRCPYPPPCSGRSR